MPAGLTGLPPAGPCLCRCRRYGLMRGSWMLLCPQASEHVAPSRVTKTRLPTIYR